MAKVYNEEIAQLKRSNYWTGVELRKVAELLKSKNKRITNAIEHINDLKASGQYDEIKRHERWKVLFLKEQEALISLQVRLRSEQYETGAEILRLRQGKPLIVVDETTLSKIRNVNWACSKLIKKCNEQRLIKVGLAQFRRVREQLINERALITYRNHKYPLTSFPFTLEQIDKRIANYEIDQKNNGLLIIKMRSIIAKNDLQKQMYKQVIKNVKLGQASKV